MKTLTATNRWRTARRSTTRRPSSSAEKTRLPLERRFAQSSRRRAGRGTQSPRSRRWRPPVSRLRFWGWRIRGGSERLRLRPPRSSRRCFSRRARSSASRDRSCRAFRCTCETRRRLLATTFVDYLPRHNHSIDDRLRVRARRETIRPRVAASADFHSSVLAASCSIRDLRLALILDFGSSVAAGFFVLILPDFAASFLSIIRLFSSRSLS
mmetsp:Transcript_12761/g.51294  ORF Transcript_12761/g.51294 Transcript_12761/m.51294 type:complete len:211 (-) Transcript_12761:1641-2273(-)